MKVMLDKIIILEARVSDKAILNKNTNGKTHTELYTVDVRKPVIAVVFKLGFIMFLIEACNCGGKQPSQRPNIGWITFPLPYFGRHVTSVVPNAFVCTHHKAHVVGYNMFFLLCSYPQGRLLPQQMGTCIG
jgi:hypothetical protein